MLIYDEEEIFYYTYNRNIDCSSWYCIVCAAAAKQSGADTAADAADERPAADAADERPAADAADERSAAYAADERPAAAGHR